MNKNSYKKNKKKRKILSTHKRGLNIGCINPSGLVSNPTKRLDLYNWIKLNNLDIICIQEWYVPKKKIVINKQDSIDDDENGNKIFNLVNLKIEFDLSIFTEYEK